MVEAIHFDMVYMSTFFEHMLTLVFLAKFAFPLSQFKYIHTNPQTTFEVPCKFFEKLKM